MKSFLVGLAAILACCAARADGDTRINFRTGTGAGVLRSNSQLTATQVSTSLGQIFTQEIEYEKIDGQASRYASFTYGTRPWENIKPSEGSAFAQYAIAAGIRYYLLDKSDYTTGQTGPFLGARLGASHLDIGNAIPGYQIQQYALQGGAEAGAVLYGSEAINFNFLLTGLYGYSLATIQVNVIELRGMLGLSFKF